MQSATQKDLQNRIDEIRDELESLFKSNLKITDWNVPEADDQNAAEILISILEQKLSEIKEDVKNKKYETY
jgi:transposase